MNTKKAKILRKLTRQFGLNYDVWKKLYKQMPLAEQQQFMADAKINIRNGSHPANTN